MVLVCVDQTLRQRDTIDDKKQKLCYANLECYLNLKHQKVIHISTVNVMWKNTTPDGNNQGEEVEKAPKSAMGNTIIALPKVTSKHDILGWYWTSETRW